MVGIRSLARTRGAFPAPPTTTPDNETAARQRRPTRGDTDVSTEDRTRTRRADDSGGRGSGEPEHDRRRERASGTERPEQPAADQDGHGPAGRAAAGGREATGGRE